MSNGGKNRRLTSPAVKTFIGNLTKSQLVWIQGEIMDANLDRDEIALSDETGLIRVININANNSGTDWIKKGAYCMVIGAAIEKEKIHCVKLTDLSSKPLEREIWPKLVIHQQNDVNLQ